MADDLLDVQDEISAGSGDSAMPKDFKMPSQEELLAAIEKMAGLDEKTKQELRDGILGRQNMGDAAGQFGPAAVENGKNVSLEVIMLLAMISFVFLVLVLIFGYPHFRYLMNTKTKLKTAKKLMNMISMYKPEFKELLVKKIESRVSEEKIKIVCTVICIISTAIFLLVCVTMAELDDVKSVNEKIIQLSKTIKKYYTHYQYEELTKNLLENLQDQINNTLNTLAIYILLICSSIVLLFFIVVFFGYKLYKSLVERERRREEKRRQKLQKKKK